MKESNQYNHHTHVWITNNKKNTCLCCRFWNVFENDDDDDDDDVWNSFHFNKTENRKQRYHHHELN